MLNVHLLVPDLILDLRHELGIPENGKLNAKDRRFVSTNFGDRSIS
jgi:hypothetical protein